MTLNTNNFYQKFYDNNYTASQLGKILTFTEKSDGDISCAFNFIINSLLYFLIAAIFYLADSKFKIRAMPARNNLPIAHIARELAHKLAEDAKNNLALNNFNHEIIPYLQIYMNPSGIIDIATSTIKILNYFISSRLWHINNNRLFLCQCWGYKETRKFASDNNFLSSWRKMLKIFYYDNNADKFAYVRPNAQIILSIKANSHIKYLTPLYKFF